MDNLDTRDLDFGDEEEVDLPHTGKKGIFISEGGILSDSALVDLFCFAFLVVVPQIQLLDVLILMRCIGVCNAVQSTEMMTNVRSFRVRAKWTVLK